MNDCVRKHALGMGEAKELEFDRPKWKRVARMSHVTLRLASWFQLNSSWNGSSHQNGGTFLSGSKNLWGKLKEEYGEIIFLTRITNHNMKQDFAKFYNGS